MVEVTVPNCVYSLLRFLLHLLYGTGTDAIRGGHIAKCLFCVGNGTMYNGCRAPFWEWHCDSKAAIDTIIFRSHVAEWLM